jgi:pyrophosphatase PpaX
MHSPQPAAVLFDLDGTLIDSIGLLLACVRHAFEGFDGRTPTDDEWIAGIGTPLALQLAAYTDSPEEVTRLTTRYRTFQRENHDAYTTVYPGTLEIVRALYDAGHPMAIVTSKSNAMMHLALQYTGLASYMKSTIGCDSCHLHKPDPYPVRLALKELSASADNAVFVGDSPHDINAGNAAGVTTIAALWGPFRQEQLEPAKPSYFLERIDALPALVQRIAESRIAGQPAV